MSNVFIIGDLHLKAQAPISRKDNYPIAILNKLEYLASIAKSCKCNTFILLGDVFDSPITTLPYLSKVIETFKKINEQKITVYTIVGNHDIRNNRIDSLPTTALGILIATGYIKLAPNNLIIDNTVFQCFNYTDEIKPALEDEKYTVCIAHRYYEFNLDEYSLHESDINKLNYNAIVLGHLHTPCDTIDVGNTVLYRPGSLARNTSEPYNKLRVPRVLLFNCKKYKAVYVEIVCNNAEDIFVDKIEGNNQKIISMHDLINFITTSYNSADMDVREYFANLNIPCECRNIISKYLDTAGA